MDIFIVLLDHNVIAVETDEIKAKLALADYVVDPFGDDFENASIVEWRITPETPAPAAEETPVPAPETVAEAPIEPVESDSFYKYLRDGEADVWAHIGDGVYRMLLNDSHAPDPFVEPKEFTEIENDYDGIIKETDNFHSIWD